MIRALAPTVLAAALLAGTALHTVPAPAPPASHGSGSTEWESFRPGR